MSKQPLKYLKNEVIEDVTARRIREYEAKAGVTVKLPVPIEKIVEQVLGLDFEWDEIEEQPGEQILGGLVAAEKKIVLNEKHLALFQEKPGLELSTIGHEAGHWDIDIDEGRLFHPTFPGFEVQPQVVHRHARKGDRLIEVLFNRAMSDDRAYRLYKKLTEGPDSPAVRNVASSGPRPLQQSASLPSITTAGTQRIPKVLARLATFASFMSNTLTSHEGQATCWTKAMASVQAGHPALKISTLRFVAMFNPPSRSRNSFLKLSSTNRQADFFGHEFQMEEPMSNTIPPWVIQSDPKVNLPTITAAAAKRPTKNGA